jgi:hypothetical protein
MRLLKLFFCCFDNLMQDFFQKRLSTYTVLSTINKLVISVYTSVSVSVYTPTDAPFFAHIYDPGCDVILQAYGCAQIFGLHYSPIVIISDYPNSIR